MLRTIVGAILAICACAPLSQAQLMDMNFGGGDQGGIPPVACLAGALDLSLSTGCNIPFFVDQVFP